MQLVSSAISCRYVWVGVASHLLTYRNTNPSLSHSLSFSVKLDGKIVCTSTRHARGQLGCVRVWLVVLACVSLCFPFSFISFFYEHKYH
jgi:hypothetical protein